MVDVKLNKFGGNSFMKTEHKEAAVSVQMKHTNFVSTIYLITTKSVKYCEKICNR